MKQADQNYRAKRQCKQMDDNIDEYVDAIFRHDFTPIRPFGDRKAPVVIDHSSYDPKKSERDSLRLIHNGLHDGTTAYQWRQAENAAAVIRPQTARNRNTRAYYTLPGDLKRLTTDQGLNPGTVGTMKPAVVANTPTAAASAAPTSIAQTVPTSNAAANASHPSTMHTAAANNPPTSANSVSTAQTLTAPNSLINATLPSTVQTSNRNDPPSTASSTSTAQSNAVNSTLHPSTMQNSTKNDPPATAPSTSTAQSNILDSVPPTSTLQSSGSTITPSTATSASTAQNPTTLTRSEVAPGTSTAQNSGSSFAPTKATLASTLQVLDSPKRTKRASAASTPHISGVSDAHSNPGSTSTTRPLPAPQDTDSANPMSTTHNSRVAKSLPSPDLASTAQVFPHSEDFSGAGPVSTAHISRMAAASSKPRSLAVNASTLETDTQEPLSFAKGPRRKARAVRRQRLSSGAGSIEARDTDWDENIFNPGASDFPGSIEHTSGEVIDTDSASLASSSKLRKKTLAASRSNVGLPESGEQHLNTRIDAESAAVSSRNKPAARDPAFSKSTMKKSDGKRPRDDDEEIDDTPPIKKEKVDDGEGMSTQSPPPPLDDDEGYDELI